MKQLRVLTLAWQAVLAQSTITFYNDRDRFLADLEGANLIEATAYRSPGQSFWAENYLFQYMGDFEQCGLTVKWGFDNANNMKGIQLQFGEHEGSRGYGEESFEGDAIYWYGIKNENSLSNKIVTDYPFYAIGFDHAGSNSDSFGIDFPGYDVQYHEMVQIAGGANRAQFVGWIFDGEPVNEFKIYGALGSNRFNQGIGFTNVVYATPDDSASTQVGCYNKNPATRMCWATGWGDPHLVTWDGLKYDVHAKGEVVMVKSMDSDFQIQARLQGVKEPGTDGPAVTTGIAVTGSPTIQVNMASTSSATTQNFHGCPVDLYVDKEARNIFTWTGTEDARVTVNQGAQMIIIENMESNVRIKMRALRYGSVCFFTVDYFLGDCYNDETLIGLLGSPDGDYTNDWMTPSNEVIPLPEGVSAFFFQDAYDYSVDNWCLKNSAYSLFSYEAGKSFDTYAHCDNDYDDTLENLVNNNDDNELKALCNGDIGCILDGVELGMEAALDYVAEPAIERELKVPPVVPTASPVNSVGSEPFSPPTPPPTPPPTSQVPSSPPTPSPTLSQEPTPVPPPTWSCAVEEESSGSRRLNSDLGERWALSQPEVSIAANAPVISLKFQISQDINQDEMVQIVLLEQTCVTPYLGNSLVPQPILRSNIPGSSKQEVTVNFTIDPALIGGDQVLYTDNIQKGEIDFCVRYALATPQAAGGTEVNFLEVEITIFLDLSDGFSIDSLSVRPKDRCIAIYRDAYYVEGYFCEDGDLTVQLPGRTIQQGDIVQVCVRPILNARELGLRMRRIRSFTWEQEASGIEQEAISNFGPANALTNLFCTTGDGICYFETLIFASFYQFPDATISGTGIADLRFGGNGVNSFTPRLRRLLESDSNSQDRKLQDVLDDFVPPEFSVLGRVQAMDPKDYSAHRTATITPMQWVAGTLLLLAPLVFF